ncbi:MAG: hypothetical protein A3K31_13555 [Ignavibacteria bacterium RIFOXYA12_FULL_35_25]|nr:MAG: hypothetical protein A3K31_13555 [Ignavibacteria bacterium RIFOXYA12_FULL_35_25]
MLNAVFRDALNIDIPAGANQLEVQIFSGPGGPSASPASICWVTASLSAPVTSLLAEVGDRIWKDINKNGIQDDGESGFEGITVCLFKCDGTWLNMCMQTDANGNYLFKDLPPGSYKVAMNIPDSWSLSPQNEGDDDAKDSDFGSTDINPSYTDCFELSPGESDLTWDAGIYLKSITQLNKIGDFVWHDKNVNGIQDTGEPGIAGVKVELLSGSTVINSTTTDANDKYEFNDLANGNYCVRVAASNYESGGVFFNTAQTKWYATKKNQGSNDAKDSDALKNESVCVDLNNNDDLTLDFGFYKTCVSITKLADKQTAKPGEYIKYTFIVENCGDITLSGGVDLYDKLLNPTAPHKIANITPVYPGTSKSITKTYCVKSNDCGDLVNTVKAVGHPIDGSANVEFSASVTVKIDCTKPAKLGDRVWLDKDKDGIQDYGEDGIKNVVVKLYDCNGNYIKSTTTDYYGKYYFSNLTPGDYKVKFFAPTGYVFTKQDQGSNDEKDSDADPATGFTKCITLGSGVTDLK